MIELTLLEFIAYGVICVVLGVIMALNLKLTSNKNGNKNDDLKRLREYVKLHYRNR